MSYEKFEFYIWFVRFYRSYSEFKIKIRINLRKDTNVS